MEEIRTLEIGPEINVNCTDSNGRSPIMLAALSGKVGCVEELCQHVAVDCNKRGE